MPANLQDTTTASTCCCHPGCESTDSLLETSRGMACRTHALQMRACGHCGEMFFQDDVPVWYGRRMCDTCRPLHVVCAGCANPVHEDEFVCDAQSRPYCPTCYNERFYTCRGCSVEFEHGENENRDPRGSSARYCDACYDARYAECDECHSVYSREQIDSAGLCPSCRPHVPLTITTSDAEDPGNLTRRCFAVEMEIIDSQRSAEQLTRLGWECVGDGSLSTGGREYTSGPIAGKDGERIIRESCRAVKKARGIVDETCGLHVHLDFTRESAESVAKFARLCHRIQNWANSVVPAKRRNARYSRLMPASFTHCRDALTLEHAVYGQKVRNDVKCGKYHGSRYCWVNFHSWFYRGTVEIRLHAGTTRSRKILFWSEFWLKAADWAIAHTIEEIDGVESGEALMPQLGLRQSCVNYFAKRQKEMAENGGIDPEIFVYGSRDSEEEEPEEEDPYEDILDDYDSESSEDDSN